MLYKGALQEYKFSLNIQLDMTFRSHFNIFYLNS